MANILKTTIQVRRGTTEEWIANKDVIPKAGEPCLDLDLHKIKYGDGITTYEHLPFVGEGDGSSITHIYNPSGSKIFEELPRPSVDELGNVYIVTDKFTTTDDFLEGSGNEFPAGTSVVCIDSGDGIYKWDALSGVIDLSNYIDNEKFSAELDKKVDKADGSSLVENTLIEKLRALSNIKDVAEGELEIEAESGTLKVVAIDQAKINGLTEALQGKVDVTPGHSLVEDSLITKLTGMLEIKSVSEELEVTGDQVLGVKAISQDKVTGLPDVLKAKLNGVKIGDAPLVVGEDGVATIPIATADAAGAVKGSAAENAVAISGDGTMTVNNINVNKLVQTENELLILDGGTSADPIV